KPAKQTPRVLAHLISVFAMVALHSLVAIFSLSSRFANLRQVGVRPTNRVAQCNNPETLLMLENHSPIIVRKYSLQRGRLRCPVQLHATEHIQARRLRPSQRNSPASGRLVKK